ncbi:ABC transporter permease [Oscillospiraceae bacterium 50-16]|nr:ABC transporter permease [Lawsonibacter sp.]
MAKLILRRTLQMIPVLLIVLTITFVLTRQIPGDPVLAALGEQATPEMVAQMREEMHLNESVPVQFFYYVSGMLQGDFGTSISYNRPVVTLIANYLPNTLQIALVSIALAILIGLGVGTLSAIKQYSFWDYFATVLALVGVSIPRFWLGLMMVLVFSVNLGVLPPFGMGTGGLDTVLHMVMPCICLMVAPAATFTRITRSSMLEVINNDSIRALQARGLKSTVILWKHALKNALPPIVTVFGLQLATAFTGAILTETIFSWRGMGSLIVGAIDSRDYPLIQGTVVLVALAFVVINLLTDIAYMVINPKYAAESMKKG